MVVIELATIMATIQQIVQLAATVGAMVYLMVNFNTILEYLLISYYWFMTVNFKTYQVDRTNKLYETLIFRYINTNPKYDNYKVYKDKDHKIYYYKPGTYELYDHKFKTSVYVIVELTIISYKIDINKFKLSKVENFMYIINTKVMKNCYTMATLKYGEWDYEIIEEYDYEFIKDYRWGQQKAVIDKIMSFYKSNEYNKGYLLYGPTQTGKTSVARYAARMLNKTYYRLDLNKFSYNLLNSNIISKINENSIVFIDEYDKLDSDALQALNCDLHRWLQSSDILKKKIVFILTSNSDIHDDDNSVLLKGRIEKIKFEQQKPKNE